jgi:hypothetical protein
MGPPDPPVPDNPPEKPDLDDYVYHLNVHYMDANRLKSILDYDYEDETYAHVLVKHVKHVKTVEVHRKNVYQTMLNGYIIFDMSDTNGKGPLANRQCWKNHYMIIPKQPYPTPTSTTE